MAASAGKPVCIITGGSAGIGLALALRFGQLGYCIVTCGRDASQLAAAQAQIAAVAPAVETLVLDLAEDGAAQRLITTARQRFGRVDVLVNNAGIAPRAAVTDLTAADLQATLTVNMAAVFHTTQAVWPILKKQGQGIIINISSFASVDPFPGFSLYGASKAWVNLFSKAAADEGRPLGIRVYSVALGAVETRMLRGLFPDFPAGQTLTPDEVADAIATLCQEPLRWASGQTIFLRK